MILKVVSLFGVQQEKVDFIPRDKFMYVSLIEQVGGQLTTENEKKINDMLNRLYEAEKNADQLRARLLSGKYNDIQAYSKDYEKLLPVLQQKNALNTLNEEYLYASQDSAQRWILSSSVPVIETNSADIILLIFVLLLPVLVYYQDEKTKMASIIKANRTAGQSTAYAKILLIVFSVIIMCVLFFALDFLYCLLTLQKGELSAPLQSLHYYSNSPYKITIAEAFWRISAIKLLGYIFIALLSSVLTIRSKKQITSLLMILGIYVIEPFAFSDKNILYYTPFSLIKATGFLRGNAYEVINKGTSIESTMQDFVEISSAQQVIIVLIGIEIIFLCVFICYRTYCIKKKDFKVSLLSCLMCLCLLSGCNSQADTQSIINLNNSDVIVQNNTAYFIAEQNNIQMIDKSTNESTNILRDPFLSESANIKAVSCTDKYMYYLISTPTSNEIYQINLADFGQELIFSQQSSDVDAFLGLSKKNISFGIDGIKKMFFYDDNLYFIPFDSTRLYSCDIANKKITTVISDGIFNDNVSVMGNKIYYINSMLELKKYDMQSGETQSISDVPCTCLYAYDSHILASSSEGIFSIDTDNNTKIVLSENDSKNIASDGENLFYTNESGTLYMIDYTGNEKSLCEKVKNFEVEDSNRTIIYNYVSDGELKWDILKY